MVDLWGWLASLMENLILFAGFCSEIVIMGTCASTPVHSIEVRRRRRRYRFSKWHRKVSNSFVDATKKRSHDSGPCVADFAVSQYVHMDFEKGSTAAGKRSELPNTTFHLRQLQWHLSRELDANGMYLYFVQYQFITCQRMCGLLFYW